MKVVYVCLILFPFACANDILGGLIGGAGGAGPLPGVPGIEDIIPGGDALKLLDGLGKLASGDPLEAFSSFLPKDITKPLDMITSMFNGRGGEDLMSLIMGGDSDPTKMLSAFGGDDKAGSGLLTMFTPKTDKAPMKKDDCLKKSATQNRDIFGSFLPLPAASGDQLFGNVDLCKQKKEKDAWSELSSFLKNPSDLDLPAEARQQCRRGLAIERSNCRQMENSMCNLLGGEKGLEPQNIFGEMKKIAGQGTKSAASEANCENVGKILGNKDPKELGNVIGKGGTDLVLGQFASSLFNKRK